MKLLIGGQSQGKLAYALTLGYSIDDVWDGSKNDKIIFEKKIIYNLQDLIRKLMLENVSPIKFMEENLININDKIIICNEVGCGIVPMEKFEREYRDLVGDVCCMLAQKADTVERIYCGIPTKIKS